MANERVAEVRRVSNEVLLLLPSASYAAAVRAMSGFRKCGTVYNSLFGFFTYLRIQVLARRAGGLVGRRQ